MGITLDKGIIKSTLALQGKSVSWLAAQIGKTQPALSMALSRGKITVADQAAIKKVLNII
jgi:hypothetical protein